MENLIITVLVLLVGILQNPQVSAEDKQKFYQQTLPVIEKYMEEKVMKVEVQEMEKVGEIKKEDVKMSGFILPTVFPKSSKTLIKTTPIRK